MTEILNWLPTGLFLALVGIAYLGKASIKAWIEKGLQSDFDVKIERLRSDLRSSQEAISALRQGALSGAAKRREAIDNRRLIAVDRLWEATVSLGRLKFLSIMMQTINFENAAKRAPNDPKVREFFEIIGKPALPEKLPTNNAATERLYVSDKAWALFSAYQSILYFGVAQITVLQHGVDRAQELLNTESIKKLVAVALPHQKDFIEKHGAAASHYLVDELEESVFRELRNNLHDQDSGPKDIRDAAQILAAANEAMIKLQAEVK